jgi:hypothetical protein
MAFFSNLASKPPSKEEIDALRECAGSKDAAGKPSSELARTVIDEAMSAE